MRRNAPRFLSVAVVMLAALLPSPTMAAGQAVEKGSSPNAGATRLINYSGVVIDRASTPDDSPCVITFAVYGSETGGAPLWSETQNVNLDSTGRYRVLLGATTSGLPFDLFPSDEQRWLGVQVQGQPEQPRILLVSVPYAMKALEADKLSGHSASEFVTADTLQAVVRQQLQQQGTAVTSGAPMTTTNATTKGGTKASSSGATSFVDATSDQVVLVQQNGTGVGLRANSIGNSGVVGTANASPSSWLIAGVQGVSSFGSSYGIYGRATSNSSSNPGVGAYGQSDSPNGVGVQGVALGSGLTIGLQGGASSPSGNAIDATEYATSGTTYGLVAQVFSPLGTGALILNNATGTVTGPLIKAGTTRGTQFAVDGSGNVAAAGGLAANSAQIGSNPAITGQGTLIPDDLDTVHSYIGQAGHQMHFRLSRATSDTDGAKDFLIAPYTYGMAVEYAGVLESWVQDFSVHFNHQLTGPGIPAHFWVGDEVDTGGLFATAFDHGGGNNSYTVLASDRFAHTSHGPLVFQVRDPTDSYKFQWGSYNSEVTRASLTNTATATSLNLMYGPVQGTFTADSNANGAVSVGSMSTAPVNLVVGGAPKLSVFPDGNVSIGNVQDSTRLSVGSTGLFSVSDAGAVTAASINVTSSLMLSGSVSATDVDASGTVTASALNAGAVSANSVSSTSITTPTMNAGSAISTSTDTSTLNATTATVNTINSTSVNAGSLTLGNGTAILGHLSVTVLLDFSPIPANSCLTQSAGVSGAADGDTVALGVPSILGSVDGVTWFGWVSGTDTVSIRGCNAMLTASADPPAALIRVDVWKH